MHVIYYIPIILIIIRAIDYLYTKALKIHTHTRTHTHTHTHKHTLLRTKQLQETRAHNSLTNMPH